MALISERLFKMVTAYCNLSIKITRTFSFLFSGNLFLFLPVALDLVGTAAQSVIDPSGSGCADYFTFGVAALCLATTQIRSYGNAQPYAVVCCICVLGLCIIMIFVATTTTNDDKADVLVAGNPGSPQTVVGFFDALLGVTTPLWSFVPALIMVELLESMDDKRQMVHAVVFSATLNIIYYIIVGTIVAIDWGWDLRNPLMLMTAWPGQSSASRVLGALLFVSNIISYAFASVPVTAKFIAWVDPSFNMADWSIRAIFRCTTIRFSLYRRLQLPGLIVHRDS